MKHLLLSAIFLLCVPAFAQEDQQTQSVPEVKVDACEAVRAEANTLIESLRFEEAIVILEQFLVDPSCEKILQDSISLIFAHYKAAGLDGGAMSRGVFAAIDNKKDWFREWKKEDLKLQFAEANLPHLNRAIHLHHQLTSYYDYDAYLFKIMALHSFRAMYVATTMPIALATENLGKVIYSDMKMAGTAITKTQKFRGEEIKVELDRLCNILDQNKNGDVTQAELVNFMRRYQK